MLKNPTIALITRETRLKGLVARWGTAGAAKFRLRFAHEHLQQEASGARGKSVKPTRDAAALASAEFAEYEDEDRVYRATLERLQDELDVGTTITLVDRQYLPTFDFRGCLAAVVVGQDGLVANAAKYVGDVPILAVNPDPQRFDGVLLPFRADQVRAALQQVVRGTAPLRAVTLAEAQLNDGQRLLGFNDLFLGSASHTSARYVITVAERSEPQSSSGMIVSTGAGSTGWLSSMFNMYRGFAEWLGHPTKADLRLEWTDPRLAWIVREPFRSRQSQATVIAGLLEAGEELIVESLMPERGVIFSDGVESDFLEFNSGTIVHIRRAAQQAQLVVRETTPTRRAT